MAGGKGTRISSIANEIPKPMIKLLGQPILEHQIKQLKLYNITDITIIIGHYGEIIQNYFNNGNNWGVNISYYTEEQPLGTAGALFYLPNLSDSFILLNGDIIFDIDFYKAISFHNSNDADATLVCHPNSHPYDSALLQVDKTYRIVNWLNKEEPRLYYNNLVNAGIHILKKDYIFQEKFLTIGKSKIDLDRDILKPSIDSNNLFAYSTPEYIKDMGTPERFYQVEKELSNKLVMKKNLSNKQIAIFLDRDGTINKHTGFISSPEDFFLIENADAAIKKINDLGFLCIVITNQPVIARGECSFETLDLIHKKMETLLGKAGAYIDGLYFCPHHPDKGFSNERIEYKINCECRKPKAGMLFNAAKDYNIDLSKSIMIGDSDSDILSGQNAGCKTVQLTNQYTLFDFAIDLEKGKY